MDLEHMKSECGKVDCRNVQSTGHSHPSPMDSSKAAALCKLSDIFTVTHDTWLGDKTATSQVANFNISLLMLISVLHT